VNPLSTLRQRLDRLMAGLFTRHPALLRRWARRVDTAVFADVPWTPVTRQPSASRLALVTTAGVHSIGQPPFDMRNPEGDASWREIPADIPAERLAISHNYYDHSDADKDVNIVFPLESIRLLQQFGEIGAVNHRHFSLMGHLLGRQLEILTRDTAPEITTRLKSDDVDLVVLTPA